MIRAHIEQFIQRQVGAKQLIDDALGFKGEHNALRLDQSCEIQSMGADIASRFNDRISRTQMFDENFSFELAVFAI